MSTFQINYASIFGIHSVAAAIVFAVAYAPCIAIFAFKSFRTPTYVFIILTLFCGIRLAGFIIRALMAGSESFGSQLGLYTADQVLFSVGFFGLLYSAYTLVLDRELVSNASLPQGPISSITRNRRLFRLCLIVGVVLGIVGSTRGVSVDSSESERSQSHTLRIVSIVIFLVLTVLQAYRTFVFTMAEHSGIAYTSPSSRINSTHGNWVLCAISILLLLREAFSLASVVHQRLATIEALWYPLEALPELLAVFLYATPGLVPPRSQLVHGGFNQPDGIAMVKHNYPHGR